MKKQAITVEEIRLRIRHLPNRFPFLLSQDLAHIYGTEVKRINEAVKRNSKRFPEDFLFQLSSEEVKLLKSQNAALRSPRANPYGFYREGANMLSAVLHSETAIERSVQIMRAFTAFDSQKTAPSEKFQETVLLELQGMMRQMLELAQNWEKMSERVTILESQMEAMIKVKGSFNENHWLFGKFAEAIAEGIDQNREEISKLKKQFENTSQKQIAAPARKQRKFNNKSKPK